MQRIVFEAETVDDLVRKCEKFIGMSSLRTQTYGTGHVVSTWPVPSWAPKGSRWFVKTTPPTLLGPDAIEIPIRWVAGTAQRVRATKVI